MASAPRDNQTGGEVVGLAELVDMWNATRQHAGSVMVHDPGGSGECMVRVGELVATPAQLATVLPAIKRWVDGVEHLDADRMARVRLRSSERRRCVEIASEFGLSPNHVHVGSAVLFGTPVLFGTGAVPSAASPPEPPAQQLWDPPVTAAVLDTGLDPHPWFAARPWLSEWGLAPEVLDADGLSGQDRQAGHGTFVAGVLLQHAPGVTIRHHRTLASTGLSDDLIVAGALRTMRTTAAQRGSSIDVIVLACGCYTAQDRCPPALVNEIARYSDCTGVAAAGNGASARPFWPAALPEVLAVAATGAGGDLATFSNHGDWVDAAAPGVDVVSSFVRMSDPDGVQREYTAAAWSGTSFAAPRVAAEVAALRRSGMDAASAREQACARSPVPGRPVAAP